MGYSKDIYNSAIEVINKRKSDSFKSMQNRQQQLYKQSLRAKEIETELGKTGVKIAKAVLCGADVSKKITELKEVNLGLQNELKQILISLNFPSDYLDVKYTCAKCKDTGFIDGKACSCLKECMREIAYDKLNKLSPLSISTFGSFNLSYYTRENVNGKISPFDMMEKILEYCKKYSNEFTPHSKSILMQGGTGLGKTHLSLAIAGKVIDKGYGCIYASAPTLLNQIEKEHFHHSNRYNEKSTIDLITECDLLIIDDLGTEFQTSFTSATIYNTLNSRLLIKKPFILNTNLIMAELEKAYSERFVSRIVGDVDRLVFMGSDLRQKIRKYKI
jgi:DNA replication protein DnaC